MNDHEASRTLVKSPPELWTECSDAASLGRHLNGSFGEIRITRLDPETAVAWEGEHVSGTVRLEPSGWGTRVVLTARANGVDTAAARPLTPIAKEAPVAVANPQPEPAAAEATRPAPVRRRRGFVTRMRGWLAGGRRPAAAAAAARAADAVPAFAIEPVPAPAAADAAPAPSAADAAAPPADAAPSAADAAAPPPDAAAVPADAALAPPADPASAPDAEAILVAALDSLGQAHHRPFSRA